MRLITGGPFRGLPEHHFKVLYLDPPWRFQAFNNETCDRHPSYPTMTLAEISAMPVLDLAARDCWLYVWTYGAFLNETCKIVRKWGFRYSSVAFTWVKLNPSGEGYFRGLGKTTRKNTECVLMAKLGAPRILSRPDELIVSPVREHSRKPDEARDRIAAMARGPRLELFARQRAPGWRSWGNDVGLFPPAGEVGGAQMVSERGALPTAPV
jgi:N6-adenosine-specific RNA methylase IME4